MFKTGEKRQITNEFNRASGATTLKQMDGNVEKALEQMKPPGQAQLEAIASARRLHQQAAPALSPTKSPKGPEPGP
jgi:hypothetical protein